MKSSSRERSGRGALYGVTLGAIALGACQFDDAEPSLKPEEGAPSMAAAGGAGATGGSNAGGGTGGSAISPSGGTGEIMLPGPECHEPVTLTDSPFCALAVSNTLPATRVLFSWTTAEQIEELRQGRVLLTRTETAGLGRGYAFTSIDALATQGTETANALLTKISSELFVKVRYAWPHAWATRMGWPGEDYGDQLLRIVLKPEAWILIVNDAKNIAVIDMQNNPVTLEDALAHSERIGAIYFNKTDVTGSGSFRSCSGGYREYIVGNEAMIEEWSLGTEQIRDQIEADASLIEGLLTEVRAKPVSVTPDTFNRDVACAWDYPAYSEVDAYERALSMPSEYYVPMPAELATLAETLRASAFDPSDPLVVKPGG